MFWYLYLIPYAQNFFLEGSLGCIRSVVGCCFVGFLSYPVCCFSCLPVVLLLVSGQFTQGSSAPLETWPEEGERPCQVLCLWG